MPIIAIMTDFGLKDGNVGVMKGVIWDICPQVQFADISQLIAPQDLREAALILARSAPYFPKGTIHLVVVDPGVGTARRPLAARIGESYYVGPDNGIITLWLQGARAEGIRSEFVHLDQPKYWLSRVSHVFHGRDVFAPVAAHLAKGISLRQLGSRIDDPVEVAFPAPLETEDGWEGEIIHIDHFGNVALNVQEEHLGEALKEPATIGVECGEAHLMGLVDTFGARAPGEVVALMGSTGNLVISVVNGSASKSLGLRVGDRAVVSVQRKGRSARPGAGK